MVNIIMPAYNGHKTIRQAIASVAMQDDLDNIFLTIVDDCSDAPYDYLLNDFHYMNIEILRKPTNTGCGQSRQYGIDRCKCEYFMFLDIDDVLYSPNAVKKLHTFMENRQLDFLTSDFIQELGDDDNEYLLHQNSGVWMHGKMFRTEYIKKNDIRYNETRLHEDHAFNTIVFLTGGKGFYIEYTTYVWKHNQKSLTNSNNSFSNNSFNYSLKEFIINAEYTVSELYKRNVNNEEFLSMLKKYVLSFYRYYNVAVCSNISKDNIECYLNRISAFFANIPESIKPQLSKEYLSDEFYEDYSIQLMSDLNTIINIGFGEYYDFFHKSLYNSEKLINK